MTWIPILKPYVREPLILNPERMDMKRCSRLPASVRTADIISPKQYILLEDHLG